MGTLIYESYGMLKYLIINKKRRKPFRDFLLHSAESEAPFAEGEGFKPPIPERGIPDFESSAIDHSANLPLITVQK